MPAKHNIVQRDITVSDAATPFGCCKFFDECADEIMGLHFSGELGLLDWMGFNVSDECYRSVEFVTFNRLEHQRGDPTPGHLGNACADPNGIETGFAKITVEDFGRYGRRGKTRDIMRPQNYCKTSPRRRLDGTVVTDEREWDLRFATEVLLDDVRRHIVTGNASTPGQFDGLQRWVRTGYSSGMLDSIVIDWNGNPMSGGAGITWNGSAVDPAYDFIDVLSAAFRRIKTRISWARELQGQRMRVGDIILVLPSSLINCVLDAFTCWSVCPGAENIVVAIQSYEARQFRTQLLGGLFGYGQIYLDGFPIPLLAHDYELIQGPSRGDIYLLTGAVGSYRIWEGEHINAATAAAQYGGQGYFSTDGGRILGLIETENECRTLKAWMHPRLFCVAPWAQVRFQDVKCLEPGGFLSADPMDTSYYPEKSFNPAVCPPDGQNGGALP